MSGGQQSWRHDFRDALALLDQPFLAGRLITTIISAWLHSQLDLLHSLTLIVIIDFHVSFFLYI